jgi:hypothetical protein
MESKRVFVVLTKFVYMHDQTTYKVNKNHNIQVCSLYNPVKPWGGESEQIVAEVIKYVECTVYTVAYNSYN